MSQYVQEAIEMAEIPRVDTRTGHPPRSGQNNPPQGESGFVDGSGPLFSMYLQLAGEEDKKMTENWKGDADGILIFTGLFSAAVAALVAVSVQDLKPNSQDISAFYLANIYQVLADSNGSQVLIPPTLPNPSIPFSPPASAVWVNSLWFLSLVVSLTCALLATSLQQWARRYMKVTQTRYSPHKRARIRAFFAEGVDKLHLPWAVEALPGLLHLSLFLFFAGLAVFLFNINPTVFNVAVSWVGLCTGVYMCITFVPMFRHDSPYYAPLSSSAWYLHTRIWSTLFQILLRIAMRCNLRFSILQRVQNLWLTFSERTSRGMEKEFEATALLAPSEIDGRALVWTYESLDEDHELEQFFAGLPGICSSKVVDNPQSSLDGLRSSTVAWTLTAFLERTWSSNLVSEAIKMRRLLICIRAIDAAHLWGALGGIFNDIFESWPALFQSIELGHSLISWGNNDNRETAWFAQAIIACIIANVPQRNEHNERWFSLTMHHLDISEHVLQGYLDHGDSVLLANLINFIHQFVRNILKADWEEFPLPHILQRLGSNYDVQNALPGLQHDFCGLRNGIILRLQPQTAHVTGDRDYAISYILGKIHPIYIALHQGSTWTDQLQLCSIPSHLMDSAFNFNEVDHGRTETASAPIATSPTLHHHDAVPSVIPPITEYDARLRLPTTNLDYAIQHIIFMHEQSHNLVLDHQTPVVSAASSIHFAPLENNRISDGTPADPIQLEGTTDPSAIQSMVNTGSRPASSHGTASRPTRNITTATPSLVPDTVPSPIPLLTVSPDPAVPHLSTGSAVNQPAHPPDDGSISLSSSQISTCFPLAPQVISSFNSNAAAEIGPLNVPSDTLDLNRRIMSQSFTPSSLTVAEHSLPPEGGDSSEISGPSRYQIGVGK